MSVDIDTEELKSYAPIIPYVRQHYGNRIPFVKYSDNLALAKCIWHKEDTASLTFFANGTYKCFGCGEHGDVITLTQKLENLTFQEACKMIGDNVGYSITLEEPNPLWENYKDQMDNHNRRYWINLQNNGDALKYLICERGITKENIDLFRLGFTDENEYRYRTDIGNISSKIVFPILEHKRRNPKCVGMAYRGFTNEKPKYINDANQEGKDNQNPQLAGVFIKGNYLYGMPLAYKGIAQQGNVILVEGYFDVISMHQAGFTNTVGVMGTSITENQISEIVKVTKNVLLFLDGDKAGSNAMIKSIASLYKAGLNVVICALDNNLDPADLCLQNDFDHDVIARIIKQYTKQSIDIVIDNAVERYQSMVSIERIRAVRLAMPIIECIENKSIQDLYKAMLFKKLDLGGN